jgi:enamine deaminase RidA (YjgF/YER057c/UK114 family)
MDDIVSGNVYLCDMQDYDPMNRIYRQHFSKGPGVRTCLMPAAGAEKSPIRLQGSFIAARTRSE